MNDENYKREFDKWLQDYREDYPRKTPMSYLHDEFIKYCQIMGIYFLNIK